MRAKLTYSHETVEKPVIAEIIIKTGLSINILEAKVNAQKGELIVSIPAAGKKLEEALKLFKDAGVQVQKFTAALQIDRERCTSCGACISPCPTGALKFGPDWAIELDETKCIACRICVNACPVKAITVP
jgi:NAD-dependent dihydropyrimidine dehydrogenase PreA subunit